MSAFSLNGKFILEPYQSDHQLKATQGAGFAMIQQKVNLVGLKLLVDVRKTQMVDADRMVGPILAKKGATVYIKEEILYTQPWAKVLYSCKDVEGKFMIVDQQYIEFIAP